ncbi:MAG: L-2-amino-thiazoline-4-carboxylic acid hydrolase [Candidatus Hodarchaeales archaeon]|jgi:hypothetical protein
MEKNISRNYDGTIKRSLKLAEYLDYSLQELNDFLVSIDKDFNAEEVEKVVFNLKKRLEGIKNSFHDHVELTGVTRGKYPALKDRSDLLDVSILAILSFLGVSEVLGDNLEKEIEILNNDVLKAYLYFPYHWLQALMTISLRSEAISYYKNHVDTKALQAINSEYFENLHDFADHIEENLEGKHDFVSTRLSDGVRIRKTEKCNLHEVSKGLNDPEIAYALVCHVDFVSIKRFNEHFALTREQTLMDGDYCDFCWHDTRVDKEMVHPSREFWENL